MKGTFGYLLLGTGFGAVVSTIVEINNVPEWKAWIVFLLFACGLVLVLEDYKETIKDEIREEFQKMSD